MLPLHRVFHGIRLLRLIKIGCRETINFFLYISNMLIQCKIFMKLKKKYFSNSQLLTFYYLCTKIKE